MKDRNTPKDPTHRSLVHPLALPRLGIAPYVYVRRNGTESPLKHPGPLPRAKARHKHRGFLVTLGIR